MLSRLSIVGLYNYNNNLFDGLILPQGLDKDVLIDLILGQAGDLSVTYPDFDFCKKQITKWAVAKFPIWQKLYDTTKLEYNPIENYDRQEMWTDSGTTADTANSTTTTDSNSNNVNSATAFNSDSFKDTDKAVLSAEGTSVVTSNNSGTNNSMHNGRVHGNIGVTTSQQMIMSQREVSEFDIYNYIADSFIDKFCIGVY